MGRTLRGLFRRVDDGSRQAQAHPRAAVPGDLDALLRMRDVGQRVATRGVEAPAVITQMDPGAELPSGGVMTRFWVTIAPEQGAPYPAVVQQPMMRAMLDDLSVGQPVTVRYDPDDPQVALISSW